MPSDALSGDSRLPESPQSGSGEVSEATLTLMIDSQRTKLAELLARRAGTMRPDGETGWCCCCGENVVYPARGEDTCPDCVRAI